MTFTFAFNELIKKIRKERRQMDVRMKWVRGHVEVYDRTGRFLFSADSESEALRELEEAA